MNRLKIVTRSIGFADWPGCKKTRIRSLLVFVGLLFIIQTSSACDFCNCYLGLNPGYNKNTIGLRGNLRFAAIDIPASNLRVTHLGHEGSSPALGGTLNETISDVELFARIYPTTKLQLFLNAPYSHNSIHFHDTVETRSGLSDMTLMAMFQIANTLPHDSAMVRHRLFAGAGIKLPTGKYKTPENVTIPMADHLYSGTGSTDFIFAMSYIGKFKKLGWNLEVNYKVNTENNINYKYGNSFNAGPSVFYEFTIHSLKIYPHLGVAYESGKPDEIEGMKQLDTGGKITYGSTGIDFYYSFFSVSTDFRIPVYHDLAAGMAVDKSWFITSVNLHF